MIRISQREMNFIQVMTPEMGASSGHSTYGVQAVTPKKQEVFEHIWKFFQENDWGPYYQGGHQSNSWFYIESMRSSEVDPNKLAAEVAKTASVFGLELK